MLYPGQHNARVEQRTTIVVTLLCSGAVFALMLVPALVGRVYVCDDLGAFHLPLRQFYGWCLTNGESFAWWPHLFGGFYALGEGQAGMFHPWHLLLYRYLPVNIAWNVELLANYPLLFAGTFFFLRTHLKRNDAALAGGSLVTFSGFALLHFMHVNSLSIIAHLPWLLLAIDYAATSESITKVRVALLAIALLTGSQLLLGYPQYVWMSLIVEGGYIFAVALQRHVAVRRLVALIMAAAMGVAIGAIQLWPTYEALTLSARSAGGPAFAGHGSLHPANLVQFLAPYLFFDRVLGRNTHELGVYCGSTTLLLAVWLLASRSELRGMRWLTGFAIALIVVGLWLAVGQYSWLYPLLTNLPLVGSFRFPARYLLLAHFGLCLLAGVAIVMLAQRTSGESMNRRTALLAVWIAFAASFTLAALGPMFWPTEQLSSQGLRWIGPALFLASAIAITFAARGYRFAIPALVALAIIDQGAYGLSYAVLPHTKPYRELQTNESLKALPAGARIASDLVGAERDAPFAGNQSTAFGYHRIDGYAGLIPQSRLDYRQLDTLRLAGVEWVHRRAVEKVTAEFSSERGDWHPVPDPLPRVRCITKVIATDTPAESMAEIAIETTATVGSQQRIDLEDQAPGTAMLIEDRPGRMEVETASPSKQVLVTTERFHPGWHASIADHATKAIRVNGDFLGCIVPAGTHRVAFRFEPTGQRYGAVISIIALLVTFGGCIFCPSSLLRAPLAAREPGNAVEPRPFPLAAEEKALT